jgi:hypothetical protein
MHSNKNTFFFETEANFLPHRLIKKKRIAQLIYGKPGKNQYKQTRTNYSHGMEPHNRTGGPPNSPDTQQSQIPTLLVRQVTPHENTSTQDIRHLLAHNDNPIQEDKPRDRSSSIKQPETPCVWHHFCLCPPFFVCPLLASPSGGKQSICPNQV